MSERSTTTEPPDPDWADALRYAAALRSDTPVPVIDELPRHPAPLEAATLRTIATYERRYPVGSSTQWADRQGTAVIATTTRLLVNTRFRGWLSFWFADVDTLEPVLDGQPPHVDLTWSNNAAPLRLSGSAAPSIAVHVAAYTDPHGWTEMPALQLLLRPAPRPG